MNLRAGNTSKRESECPFPKLKLKFKDPADTKLVDDRFTAMEKADRIEALLAELKAKRA